MVWLNVFRAVTTTEFGSAEYAMNSLPGEKLIHPTAPLAGDRRVRMGGRQLRASAVVHNGIVPSSQAAAIIDPVGEKMA